MAVKTGHQLATFHGRLTRMPIRNTTSSSPVTAARSAVCRPLWIEAMVPPGSGSCGEAPVVRFLWSGSRGQDVTTRSGSRDRKSTRLNSSHTLISYAVFCLKKKNNVIVHILEHANAGETRFAGE